MTGLYLSLADHAVAELLDAHATFEKLQAAAPDKRSAHQLARAVIGLHLAIDKATKLALSTIDPALLIKSLSGETIQRLQLERARQKLPSILAVAGKEETHHLMGLLHIGRPFFVPPLREQEYDEFIGHVQDLVDIRNQLVHKEFVGQFDHVATVLVQVLSRLRAVMQVMASSFLRLAYQQNDQLESRLKALELEVDAAWQVLIDFLGESKGLDIPTVLWVTLSPGTETADVSMSSESFLENGIYAGTQILRSAADGFLVRELPPPPPVPSLLFYGAQPLSAVSSTASTTTFGVLGRLVGQEPPKPEERLLLPSQDSSISAIEVPARVSLSLPGRKKSFLGLNAIIEKLQLVFKQNVREGSFTATLKPAAQSGKAPTVAKIRLSGRAVLEAEFATSTASEHFVSGTTLRRIKIDAKLERDSESGKAVEP